MNENKLLYYYIIVIAQWSQNKNAGGHFLFISVAALFFV
jgi:hypothetical protein